MNMRAVMASELARYLSEISRATTQQEINDITHRVSGDPALSPEMQRRLVIEAIETSRAWAAGGYVGITKDSDISMLRRWLESLL